ncbi:MAG: hypothetical protein QGH85_02175 [Candidatus Pacebacteria bacterium]|jgi:hypothetical protein|nr:hypothetical protein [Parcubacteria group bacterium]MDP7159426.1 hypothetical protein [Candidatus Paceibacterota bacterium]MDP7366544.1 hypothetical protein [Candidatus Paceibacterota bacterium]MDP7466406.1 hypothetical protein [Candidatus Paceibacterota bacterium]MDP7648404.1 hypothetical protein [Candidatus Paceibacterota bacterium]|tara:strand:- start:169 stop:504 length:336 start_codon:yes stop_codon:yes gene_type:complete
MINKENIVKIFKKKSRKPGTSISAYISNAKYTWGIIIAVFVVLNIGIIAFSGYLFLEINEGDIFKVEQDITVIVDTIDRKLLSETLDSFDAMENEIKELKEKRPSVIDPSL